MPLNENIFAPEFELPDENGVLHRLSDYRGKKVLLYFYPKDNTSGCTQEACNFRDDYSQYEAAGIVILGVSADPIASHEKFKLKLQLPFTLLSDENHEVCELYDVWGVKKMYGKEYFGILRTTYLIDENGKIMKVFEKVKPAAHSEQVLRIINE
jgi:peroxiredoxin Q/BCP